MLEGGGLVQGERHVFELLYFCFAGGIETYGVHDVPEEGDAEDGMGAGDGGGYAGEVVDVG